MKAAKSPFAAWTLVVVATGLGLLITWVDTRPNWDDTGITVGLILCASAGLGFAKPRLAWVAALGVGIWVPLWNILTQNNYESVLGLAVAFVGAYIGAIARWLVGTIVCGSTKKRSIR